MVRSMRGSLPSYFGRRGARQCTNHTNFRDVQRPGGAEGRRDDAEVQAASDRAATTTQVPSLALLIR